MAPPGAVTVRQAVCDRRRALIGYEILAFEVGRDGRDAVRATARALLEAFTADLDLVAPHHPAYVTVAGDALRELDVLPVAPDRVVLQVDEEVLGDPALRDALARLAAHGYAVAARDPRDPDALRAAGVIGLARVGVAGLDGPDAGARVRAMHAAGLTVHALGVADEEAFEACAAAGAVGFQGPFRELPRLAAGQGGADIGALTSAVELLDDDLGFDELEGLIARDLGLSYRLLRYANSALFARRREVGTVREAMGLLGERMTRRWATVLALAGTGARRPDGLLVDALLRARMLEELAADLPGLDRDHAFTVGLFSLLDALVGRPMPEALAHLGLPRDVEAALLRSEPPYGALLDRMLRHLGGEVGGPGVARLDDAYRVALAWLDPLLAELQAAVAG